MRAAYLVDQRRRGEGNDPFLEADRRETARQEAAAKRVHPTSHLPANSQPSTQVAGLLPSSAAPAASTAPQTATTAPGTASSGAGLSLFSTPASSSPATSAPASSLFGSSGAPPQSSLFGASSPSLFGPASTPSLFSNTASAFTSTTPATGALFSTPFASGMITFYFSVH
ncbi:Nuclear pore complex protein NUP58 [Linum perenne]